MQHIVFKFNDIIDLILKITKNSIVFLQTPLNYHDKIKKQWKLEGIWIKKIQTP